MLTEVSSPCRLLLMDLKGPYQQRPADSGSRVPFSKLFSTWVLLSQADVKDTYGTAGSYLKAAGLRLTCSMWLIDRVDPAGQVLFKSELQESSDRL